MKKNYKVITLLALAILIGIAIAAKKNPSKTDTKIPAPPATATANANMPETENKKPIEPAGTIIKTSKAETSPKLPRLLDLGSDRCVPCKMMAPTLEELKKQYSGTVNVDFIDVWKNQAEAKKYNIRMIPTQIFYDSSGKELFRHEGYYSKEDILSKMREYGMI